MPGAPMRSGSRLMAAVGRKWISQLERLAWIGTRLKIFLGATAMATFEDLQSASDNDDKSLDAIAASFSN